MGPCLCDICVQLRSKATNDNPYTFVPLSSVIPAYSKTKVTIEFAPKVSELRQPFH
jgi:hypothetical protein